MMCSKQPKIRKKHHWRVKTIMNSFGISNSEFPVVLEPLTHLTLCRRASSRRKEYPAATFSNGHSQMAEKVKNYRRRPCSLAAATGEPEKPRSTCRGQIRRRSSAFSGTGRRVNCPPARRRPQPLSRVHRERRARHRTHSSSLVYQRTSELTSQFKFVSSSFQRNNSIIVTVKRSFSANWYNERDWLAYPQQADAAFCFPCRKFGGSDSTRTGYTLLIGNMLMIRQRDLAGIVTVKSTKHAWLAGKRRKCDATQAVKFQPWLTLISLRETACVCLQL